AGVYRLWSVVAYHGPLVGRDPRLMDRFLAHSGEPYLLRPRAAGGPPARALSPRARRRATGPAPGTCGDRLARRARGVHARGRPDRPVEPPAARAEHSRARARMGTPAAPAREHDRRGVVHGAARPGPPRGPAATSGRAVRHQPRTDHQDLSDRAVAGRPALRGCTDATSPSPRAIRPR